MWPLTAAVILAAPPLAKAAPGLAQEDDAALTTRVEDAIARHRFFDAHVYCLLGAALSPRGDRHTWYVVRDAFSLWMLGDSGEAQDVLSSGMADADVNTAALLSFTAAWLQFKSGDERAIPAWLARIPSSPLTARARIYLEVLADKSSPGMDWPRELPALAHSYSERRTISPVATGLLSALLPGAGHASLGLWGDAGLAFSLNVVSVGATIELAHSRLIFPAVAAGTVASLFYVGAIISSATLAHERNELERKERLAPIDALLFPELPSATAR